MAQASTRQSLYLASPLGFAESTRAYLDLIVTRLEALGLEVRNPWTSPEATAAAAEIREAEGLDDREQRRARLQAANRRIGAANEQSIRDSDLVVAVLDGIDVDSGTAAEIGFAAALGLRIYGLRTDWRRGPENEGADVNLQVQWWIEHSGGAIAHSLDELEVLLKGI
jgi:nucleoside 2-deoxyribosyltransferase